MGGNEKEPACYTQASPIDGRIDFQARNEEESPGR